MIETDMDGDLHLSRNRQTSAPSAAAPFRPTTGQSGDALIRTGFSSFAGFILFALAILCCCLPTRADEPFAGQLLVFGAEPKKTIEHGVEWKGPIDPSRRETMLTGPSHYAATLQSAAQHAVFNWYRIKDAPKAEPTDVKVWIESADAAPSGFRLGAPVYFLSMSQRISEGSPAVSEGLSHFVAYRVLDGAQGDRELTLSDDSETREVVLKRAAFLCIPVEEWHHHEHFAVKHSNACLVVYEIESIESAEPNITALDQFGLHSLQLKPAAWLCVPGKRFQLGQDP